AEEYIEAGMARYDLELGHGPPGRVRPPRPVFREDVPPRVPDFAHWMAEEKRKQAAGVGNALDDAGATAGDGSGDAADRQDDRVPVMLAGNGDRENMQNGIGEGEEGFRAEVEPASELSEGRSHVGALERGNTEGELVFEE